jgi:hypothetical protein
MKCIKKHGRLKMNRGKGDKGKCSWKNLDRGYKHVFTIWFFVSFQFRNLSPENARVWKKKSWPFPFLTSWRSYDFYHSITISTLASQFRCGQLSNHSFHTLYICSIFFSPPSSVDPSISGERRLDQGSYPRIPAWVAGSGGVRSTDIWPYMQTSLPMYMCIFW